MRKFLRGVLAAVALAAISSTATAQTFDPKPWLEDLTQAKAVFAAKYANLEWAQFDAQTPLSDLFIDTEKRVKSASSDADARAAFDRLARRLGDGHVRFDWATGTASSAEAQDVCDDYNPSYAAAPLAAAATDYVALHTPQSAVFPAGVIQAGGRTCRS